MIQSLYAYIINYDITITYLILFIIALPGLPFSKDTLDRIQGRAIFGAPLNLKHFKHFVHIWHQEPFNIRSDGAFYYCKNKHKHM